MIAGIQRTAKAVADMSGAPAPDVTIIPGGKAVVNDQGLTERTAAIFRQAFGPNAIQNERPGTASEDYSEFILAGVSSVFFNVGGSDPKAIEKAKFEGKQVPGNHSPEFAPVPEPSIKTAVEAMSLAVLNVMGR